MKSLQKNFYTYRLVLLIVLPCLALSCSKELEKRQVAELSLQEQIAILQQTIADKDSFSEKEIALLENLKRSTNDQKASVSVGEQNRSFDFDDLSRAHVEFNAIEEPPVFKSCENAGDPDAKRDCVAAEVAKFVTANFDLSAGKNLQVAGIHKIEVSFVIDVQGNITNIKTRHAEQTLEREAERVIARLPKMIPGKHKGKAMASLYSLPILYKVPGLE